jgi:hypothetical protein
VTATAVVAGPVDPPVTPWAGVWIRRTGVAEDKIGRLVLRQ